MIRSMDILSRNFSVLQEKQENLSANAANASTPGYKFRDVISSAMPDVMMNHLAGGQRMDQFQELGNFTPGTAVVDSVTNFSDGALQNTGNPTDFAVLGDGFFSVQGPGGQNYYTRNGQFTTDDTGQLITLDGYLVQTDGLQPLVTSFAEGGVNLVDAGDGYFTGAGGVVNAADATVYQGYLEMSNGSMADVMVEMIQIQREFEANQRMLHASDETLRKATNEVGSVR